MISVMRKLIGLLFLAGAASLWAGDSDLFFREDWVEAPPSIPLTNRDLANPALEVSRHGPGGSVIKKSFHDYKPNDPYYVWSGLCPGPWAVSLRKRESAVDLTAGRVRWRARQSGFRQLRVIVQTGDGKWLVSDAADGFSEDWRVREVELATVRWRLLNIETVVEGDWVEDADLSRVLEVGFTDLMPGGRSPASSRVDWIEVYGTPVQ